MHLAEKTAAGLFVLFVACQAQTFSLNMNSGGTSLYNGASWIADAYYSGGSADSDAGLIINVGRSRSVFATRRFGNAFSYLFTSLPAGTYQIDLYFADWEATAAGQRTFDVIVNGATALTAYDIFAASLNQTSTARIEHLTNIAVPVGSLSVAFAKNGGALPAQVNGIAITQTGSLPPGKALTGCQQISTAGNYVLSTDIQVPAGYSSPCFLVLNTGGATMLDCQGHSIANASPTISNAVVADTAPNFTLTNCTINEGLPGNSAIQVLRSPQSALINNIVNNGSIFVADSNGVTLSKNSLSSGGLVLSTIQQGQISGATIDSNTIDQRSVTQLNNGIQGYNLGNSTITNNKIYGTKAYTDDAIILGSASGVTIQGNTLIGAGDVGIEFMGANDRIQILGNTMDSVNRGMGGWYDLSMTNSLIDGNNVSNATLFAFNYAHARTDPSAYTVTFQGNKISNNRVSDGCAGPCGGPSAFFDFTLDFDDGPPQPLQHTLVANNLLANNNFDLNADGPHLNPPSGFIDGGGNTCSATGIFPVAGYPIRCGVSLPCTSPANGQFEACYWSNESWSGSEAVNRLDPYPIRFNWGSGNPACTVDLPPVGANCPNNMSASWNGNFQFDAGYYVFSSRVGGGTLTVFINGVKAFSRSTALSQSFNTLFAWYMTSGPHNIQVTYVSDGTAGNADAELSWTKF